MQRVPLRPPVPLVELRPSIGPNEVSGASTSLSAAALASASNPNGAAGGVDARGQRAFAMTVESGSAMRAPATPRVVGRCSGVCRRVSVPCRVPRCFQAEDSASSQVLTELEEEVAFFCNRPQVQARPDLRFASWPVRAPRSRRAEEGCPSYGSIRRCARRSSSSSRLRGQSLPSNRDSPRSAKRRPPV